MMMCGRELLDTYAVISMIEPYSNRISTNVSRCLFLRHSDEDA